MAALVDITVYGGALAQVIHFYNCIFLANESVDGKDVLKVKSMSDEGEGRPQMQVEWSA